MAPHIGLCGSPFEDPAGGVDEGQILALELGEAWPCRAAEACRVLKRLEFHYTPKHASWLNMAEIEIGVLRSRCLDRRIDDRQLIVTKVAAWQQRRNAQGAQIQWMFTPKGPPKAPQGLSRERVIISSDGRTARRSAGAPFVVDRQVQFWTEPPWPPA
jgi:hypothetical protein